MIRPPSPWVVILTGLLGQGVALVMLVAYVRSVDAAAEHRNVDRQRQICGIIVLIDDRNQSMPPTTDPETDRFRKELHTYRLTLGC